MSQTGNRNTGGSYRQRTGVPAGGSRSGYVYGNTARKTEYGKTAYTTEYGNTARRTELQRQLLEPPKKPVQNEVRKNREKAHHMSMGYVMFLAAALIAAGLILVNYVQLQAELTNLTKLNATRLSELSNMRQANDEAYNRVLNSIDLEEIKRIAIGELGMVYAQEGQIYNYNSEGNDYMRRITEGSN